MFPNGLYMDAVSKTVFLKSFAAMEKLLFYLYINWKTANFQMFPNGLYMDAVSKTVFLKSFAAMEKLLLWQRMLTCLILLIDLP